MSVASKIMKTELSAVSPGCPAPNAVNAFHRFDVRATADPETVPRLINFFTQRGLIPGKIRVERAGEEMHALFEQVGLDGHEAQIIAERMRASVLVEAVRMSVHDQPVR